MAKSNRLAADLLRKKRRRAEETEERAVRLQSYIPQGAAIIKACTTAAPVCVVCPFLPSPFALQTYIHISIYIFENVCLFVCLFAVNAKTTERIDAKRSGITKNYPESVLCGLKSPVLALSGRCSDISGFPFSADSHFYSSPFHWLLLRRLYNTNWNTV